MTKLFKGLLTGASLLALAPAVQAADQLSYAGGWPPGSGPTGALENYAEAVGEASGGELTMRVFPLSLLSFAESNAGLRDGLADLSTILTPYFSAEFPNLNMISEFSEMVELADFSGELSSLAFAGAVSEYVMLNCDNCQEEVAAQNQVYMGAGMTTSYALQCTVPVTSPEELTGKRVRAGGAYWARWAEAMGAVPVSISIDVVKHVYIGLPGGQFTVPTMMNRDRWQGLSEESRQALMKANADLGAEMTWVYLEEARSGLSQSEERGIEVTDANENLISMNQEFIEKDLSSVVDIYAERFDLANGADASAKVRELLTRWTELTSGVESAEQLATIYWDEIYSKIDVSSYGM